MNAKGAHHHTAKKATKSPKSVRRSPYPFAAVRGQPASRLFDYLQAPADVRIAYCARVPDGYRTARTAANEAIGYQNGYQMIKDSRAALSSTRTVLSLVTERHGQTPE